MNVKGYALHTRLQRYKNLVAQTRSFIQESLQRVPHSYVACSFGKDSSVMLHMILQQNPHIVVRFATHPETNLLDDYKRVIGWWRENYDLNLQEVFCEGGLVKVKHHQRTMLNIGKWDGFFVGIRAEESNDRKFSLRKYGKFHKLKSGRIKISPMAGWREIDVGAYIHEHELPLLLKYEQEGMSARTTSGIPRTHITESLSSLKTRDVGAFNKLCEMFEDARHYV